MCNANKKELPTPTSQPGNTKDGKSYLGSKISKMLKEQSGEIPFKIFSIIMMALGYFKKILLWSSKSKVPFQGTFAENNV